MLLGVQGSELKGLVIVIVGHDANADGVMKREGSAKTQYTNQIKLKYNSYGISRIASY